MLLIALMLVFFSFIVTCIITPFIIKRMKARGIVGKDMNKFEKPEIPEIGGVAVLFGFISAVLLIVFVFSYFSIPEKTSLIELLAGLLTITIIGLIGITDDLIGWKKGLRQWQHALLPIFAALPLMALSVGITKMFFPFFGEVELGIFYSLIMIPLAVTGAANASNMLAGFNGLEAGLGIINSAMLLVMVLVLGNIEAAVIAAALLGALLAFMCFNWAPAKIFPGDSLTLMIGAGIATIAIIGNIEKYALMLYAIFFVELLLKSRYRFQTESFGIPQKDATLKAPTRISSIPHAIMRFGRFKESQVVGLILLIQAIVAGLVMFGFVSRLF